MKIPNPFKSNFMRIAENTVKYYMELNEKYADRFEDESSMLATAGVLDAQNYIFNDKPQINIETLIGLAKDSVSGVNEIAKNVRAYAFGITMNQFKKREISTVDMLTAVDSPDSLIDFIVSLEVELFEVDTSLSKRDIMLACAVKYDSIKKAMGKTKEKYTGEKTFALATATLMDSPECKVFREQLAIK